MLAALLSTGLTTAHVALPYGVVDAHVHVVTSDNGIAYNWARDPSSLTPPRSCPCAPPCFCNWTMADFRTASAPTWEVDQVVFCEVDAHSDDWLREATWVSEGGAQLRPGSGNPRIGAIVAATPPGFAWRSVEAYAHDLDQLQRLTLARGVRPTQDLIDSLPSGALQHFNATVTAAFRELGRRHLVVDLQAGNVVNGKTRALATVAESTTFIVEHFGGAPIQGSSDDLAAWEGEIKSLAKLSNIVCFQLGGVVDTFHNVSALEDFVTKVTPFLNAALDAFGYTRTCFENNWFWVNLGPPFHSLYDRWPEVLYNVLVKRGASPGEIRNVLRENSIRVYNMSSTSR